VPVPDSCSLKASNTSVPPSATNRQFVIISQEIPYLAIDSMVCTISSARTKFQIGKIVFQQHTQTMVRKNQVGVGPVSAIKAAISIGVDLVPVSSGADRQLRLRTLLDVTHPEAVMAHGMK